MNTKEKIAVMQHYEDGGKIEILTENGREAGKWQIRTKKYDGELNWTWGYNTRVNYRIYQELKPKETVTIEKWLVRGDVGYYIFEATEDELYKLIVKEDKVKLLDTYEVEL